MQLLGPVSIFFITPTTYSFLVPILLARYLSPDRQRQCKDEGVNFIDLSGNIFIDYGNLYIERVGFPNRFPERRKGRGPFSDKASLILRKLISEKDKIWGVRELAGVIDLDPGFVSIMAKELDKRNYVVRVNSKIRIRNAKAILDDWVHEYNYKKNRAINSFSLAGSAWEIIEDLSKLKIPDNVNYALSLRAVRVLFLGMLFLNRFIFTFKTSRLPIIL